MIGRLGHLISCVFLVLGHVIGTRPLSPYIILERRNRTCWLGSGSADVHVQGSALLEFYLRLGLLSRILLSPQVNQMTASLPRSEKYFPV